VEIIRTFLEEVIRVVPLESICFAIGYGNPDAVLPCSQALIASNLDLPPFLLMYQGFQLALARVTHGLPPKLWHMADNEAMKKSFTYFSVLLYFFTSKRIRRDELCHLSSHSW